MGAPMRLRSPELAQMRKWRIAGFDNVSIFYKPCADGVTVVRILHAAQDWWRLIRLAD
jgi:toxin ParE1/3/4